MAVRRPAMIRPPAGEYTVSCSTLRVASGSQREPTITRREPGPDDGVTGVRQGTHLEKRVRFSGPGSRGAWSAAADERRLVGIDHVQVAAPPGCEEDARRFYGDALGLEEIDEAAAARDAGRRLVPRRRAGAPRRRRRRTSPRDEGAPGVARLDSVERARAVAAARGGRAADVDWADPAEIPGTSRFFTHDPWGNRLELIAWDGPDPRVDDADLRGRVGATGGAR